MNQKQLEAHLWESADNLRANSKLTAGEYKDPVLGLALGSWMSASKAISAPQKMMVVKTPNNE